MNRSSWLLRDAALGYASQGIPVLPLHHPLPHQPGLQPVGGDQPLPNFAPATGCSCRNPGCGQPAKHPLGSLVPHGLHEATTNRARVLAWWTQHPQANIGLATGHLFDVLDVDGPTGTQAIRTFAAGHALHSCGPLVRTGGGGWHYYLAPTGSGNQVGVLERVDWRGRGGYVVAPPSRHRSGHPYQWVAGRDLDTPLPEIPGVLLERLQRQLNRSAPVVVSLPVGDGPGSRYGQAALTQELARVATAPHGQRNQQLWKPPATSTTSSRPALWTTSRSARACSRPPNAADCSATSPARPTAPWPPATSSAWPTPARHLIAPTPTPPMLRHPRQPEPVANEPRRGGDGDSHRRPPDRLIVSVGWARAAAKQSPHPPRPPRRKEPAWAAVKP